jgi:hypothetical protein
MPATVQQQTAYFTALTIRATLYGFYIASSVVCFRWLLFDDQGRKLRKRINWRLISVAAFIFCFLTTTLVVTSQAALDLIPGDLHSAVLSISQVHLHNKLPSTVIVSFSSIDRRGEYWGVGCQWIFGKPMRCVTQELKQLRLLYRSIAAGRFSTSHTSGLLSFQLLYCGARASLATSSSCTITPWPI